MQKKNGAWAMIYCPREDTLLLGKRSTHVSNAGLWNHFGGCLDDKESPKQGLKRELYEETRISLSNRYIIQQNGKPLRKLGCIENRDDRTLHYYLLLVQQEFSPKLNKEHSDYYWFNSWRLPHKINKPTRLSGRFKRLDLLR